MKIKTKKNKRTKSGVVTRRFSARVVALERALRYVPILIVLLIVLLIALERALRYVPIDTNNSG